MKKLKIIATTLCLVATLAFAVPTTTYANAGPQGTSNSGPKAPAPIDWAAVMLALMKIF